MDELKRKQIYALIEEWNINCLDLFEIIGPDENLEFHGVIRFFYQDEIDPGSGKTKCLRVSSSTTSDSIVATLIAKFHADMRMLSQPSAYALYAVTGNSERRLGPYEKPLIVQLDWGCKESEGRFVLRRGEEAKRCGGNNEPEFARNTMKLFSKNKGGSRRGPRHQQQGKQAETYSPVYDSIHLPFFDQCPSTFERTMSNPELVLKRRREIRTEQLSHCRNLKIYGVELFPQRPYITLIVNETDTARQILEAALEKYGVVGTDSNKFVLVEVFLLESENTNGSFNYLRGIEKQQERWLGDEERPLQLLTQHLPSSNMAFFLRRRVHTSNAALVLPKSFTLDSFFPSIHSLNSPINIKGQQIPNHSNMALEEATDAGRGTHFRRHQSDPAIIKQILAGGDQINGQQEALASFGDQQQSFVQPKMLPCLVPINTFASSANFGAGALALQTGITEIGSSSACAIQLRAPTILPRHCCLIYRPVEGKGRVIVSLLDKSALVELNGASIHSATELFNGVQLRIGGVYCYRFFNGTDIHRTQDALSQITPVKPLTTSHYSRDPRQYSVGDQNLRDLASESQHYTSFNIDTTNNYEKFEKANATSDGPIASSTPDKMTVMKQKQRNNDASTVDQSYMPERPIEIDHNQEQRCSATLPILIECVDEAREDKLFNTELFSQQRINLSVGHRFGAFRLIPAFLLYSLCRQRIMQKWNAESRQRIIGNTIARFIAHCSRTIQANVGHSENLVFWLSNASELLNMVRSDAELAQSLGPILLGELAQLVQKMFELLEENWRQRLFTVGIQSAISQWTPTMASSSGEFGSQLIASLDECLRTVRWALLNPALTIQLFSQMFHFISATIFNWLVTNPETRPLISLRSGIRLKQLLVQLQKWAEQQGLELAAECHLDQLQQTVNLLTTPKNLGQIATLGATCYRLNSSQVRCLLEHYTGDVQAGETPTVSREVIEHVVALARQQADQMVQGDSNGRPKQQSPQLLHPINLQLPFLIPQDGYIIEKLHGIPSDMAAFVNELQQKDLIRVFVQQPLLQQHSSMTEITWNMHLSRKNPVIANDNMDNRTHRREQQRVAYSSTPSKVAPQHFQQPGRSGTPFDGATIFPTKPHHNGEISDYAEIHRSNGVRQPIPMIRSHSASIFEYANSTGHYATSNHPLTAMSDNKQRQQSAEQQWNERQIDADGPAGRMTVQRITIRRPNGTESIGLSIVEVGTTEQGSGIFVKNVIEGSPADKDGRLAPGDQLLSVNGQSLMNVRQDMAAQKKKTASPSVHLEVAKSAAQLNGLAAYFQQNNHQNGIGYSNSQHQIQQQKPTSYSSSLRNFHSQPQLSNNNNNNSLSGLAVHQIQKCCPPPMPSNNNSGSTSHTTTAASCRIQTQSTSNLPPMIHHQSQHSSSTTSSLSSSRLPAHYRPSASRPQVVVMQPGRPAAPNSPLLQPNKPRDSNTPAITSSGSESPHHMMMEEAKLQHLADYTQLPLITSLAGSPPINSSTTTSNASSTSATMEDNGAENVRNAVEEWKASNQSRTALPTGRNSAPLFGDSYILSEQNTRHFAGTQLPEDHRANLTMTAEEVERELDRLDSMVGAQQQEMDESDQQHYRQFLEKLSTIRGAANSKMMENGGSANGGLPPSIAAAAQQLERQSKSLAALSLDPGNKTQLAPSARSTGNLLKIKRVIPRGPYQKEAQYGEQNQQKQTENKQEMGQEEALKQKQPPTVPVKPPIIREVIQRTLPAESLNMKKRVQFCTQNNDNISLDEPDLQDDEVMGDGGEENEPRVQIVGAQEVYVNDPRQRRLQEMQANQKVIKPVVDSSSLGFREKMRIFAEQLGEKEPPALSNQHKSSSAERRIVQEQKEDKGDENGKNASDK